MFNNVLGQWDHDHINLGLGSYLYNWNQCILFVEPFNCLVYFTQIKFYIKSKKRGNIMISYDIFIITLVIHSVTNLVQRIEK